MNANLDGVGGFAEANALLAISIHKPDIARKIIKDSTYHELRDLKTAADELSELCQELMDERVENGA